MEHERIIPWIALLVSIVSAIVSALFVWKQNKNSSISQGSTSIQNAEKLLAEVPSALKFHGIKKDDLIQAGLTPQEFAYLVTSFTAGASFYRTLPNSNGDPFEKGSYRYTMCSQPSTIRAWPLVRIMMDDHIFRKKVDRTIADIEIKQETHST